MEQFKVPDDDLDDREPMSEDRAQRFYDRLRGSIQNHVHGKFGEYLLLVPDMFMLLWRLANDSRVSGKNKVLLGTGIAYYIFPFDFLPEAFVGPMGYLDDLIFAVYVLNKMLMDTDVEILRAHWSGSEDLLDAVRRVLGMADQFVTSNVLNKLKKMF
jgi:uncharacterized membrane protein YkvA (DUF1232 family)